MYGTIFRMKVKSGQEQAVVDNFNDWQRERRSKVKGAIGALLMKPDAGSGELVGVAVFEDKATYEANANDPEQDRWFRSLRELLDADPEWEDGEYVAGDLG
jgi:quinol monooxygenase YgiN